MGRNIQFTVYNPQEGYTKARFSTPGGVQLANFVTDILFNEKFQAPVRPLDDMHLYDITSKVTIPQGLTLEDVIDMAVLFRIETIDDLAAKEKQITEHATQKGWISSTMSASDIVKPIRSLYEAIITQGFRADVLAQAYKIRSQIDTIGNKGLNVKPSDFKFSSILGLLNDYRTLITSFISDSASTVLERQIGDFVKKNTLVANSFAMIQALTTSSEAKAYLPAHYVYRKFVPDNKLIGNGGSIGKMIKYEPTTDVYSFETINYANGSSYDRINLRSALLYNELVEAGLFLSLDHNTITKALSASGDEEALIAWFREQSEVQAIPLFATASEDANIEDVDNLVSEIACLLYVRRICNVGMEPALTPLQSIYDVFRVDRAYMADAKRTFEIVTTAYTCFLEAYKLVFSSATAATQTIAKAIGKEFPNNLFIPGVGRDIGPLPSMLKEMESAITEFGPYSRNKKWERYIKYRTLRIADLQEMSMKRDTERDIRNPFDNFDIMAQIKTSVAPIFDIPAKYEIEKDDQYLDELSKTERSKWTTTEDFSKAFTYIRLKRDGLTTNTLADLSGKFPMANVSAFITPQERTIGKMVQFRAKTMTSPMDVLIRERLSIFAQYIPSHIFGGFDEYIKAKLKLGGYEVRHFTSPEALLFDMGLAIGKNDTIKTFRASYPLYAEAFLNDDDTLISQEVFIINDSAWNGDLKIVVDKDILDKDVYLLHDTVKWMAAASDTVASDQFYKVEITLRHIGKIVPPIEAPKVIVKEAVIDDKDKKDPKVKDKDDKRGAKDFKSKP